MARNYIKVNGIMFHFQSPTLPGVSGDLAAWGADLNDLLAQRDRVIQLFNAANPGNDVEFTYPTDPITAYVLYDKPSVLQTLNWQGNGLYFYALSVNVPLADQNMPMLVNPKTSPRYTGWKDSAGEVHNAPPSDKKGARSDFSGAGGLITFLHNLPAYALLLKSEGRTREAGIVTFVYNQILAGAISITEGLKILRDNFL